MTKTWLHFYFGQEHFLVDEATQALINSHPNAELSTFDGKCDISTLVQSAQSTGLFASEKIIVLKTPDFLAKKCSDKEQAALSQFFSTEPLADIQVVINYHGSIDQRKKLPKLLKKHASCKQFEPFKDWEQEKVLQWIRQRIKGKNKTIAEDALNMLHQICGNSLQHCASEIETLCTFLGENSHIELETVKAFCTESQSSIYDFTEALKKREYSTLYQCSKRLLNMGEDPIKMMGLLSASYRFYAQLLALSEQGLGPDAMAKKIGRHPFFVKQVLQEIARNYELQDIKNILITLAKLDVAIKSGEAKAPHLFETLPLSLAKTPA